MKKSIVKIKRTVEIRCITSQVARGPDLGSSPVERIDELHVERADGTVSVVTSPGAALALVMQDDAKRRRALERAKSPAMLVTKIDWVDVPDGFEPPSEVQS